MHYFYIMAIVEQSQPGGCITINIATADSSHLKLPRDVPTLRTEVGRVDHSTCYLYIGGVCASRFALFTLNIRPRVEPSVYTPTHFLMLLLTLTAEWIILTRNVISVAIDLVSDPLAYLARVFSLLHLPACYRHLA